MLKVSIVSLIYQSAGLADWVHDSVHKFTPMIARGEAEFFFVANDPTVALLDHLRLRGYQHVVNVNQRYTDDELFALGYGTPEYMSRVYRGYNEGVRQAKGDYVVLVNSDNYFSPDWLENLLKYSDRSRVISSTLVERNHPTFSVFPGALHGEFGGTVETFDETAFLAFAARVKKTGVEKGGAFMPTLLHRDIAIEAGLYPCGNIAGDSFERVAKYGDEAFFDVLNSLGVSHYTSLDSISYHLKEGERADTPSGSSVENDMPSLSDAIAPENTPVLAYPIKPALDRVRDSMAPSKRHDALMALLVADTGESPATRTLRQLVASGLLTEEQEKRAKAEIADPGEAQRLWAQNLRLEEQERRLAEQGQMVRRLVERVVGERRSDSVMTAIHSVSWITRPVRRALAGRGRKGRRA